MHYNYRTALEEFCAGIAFGADHSLSGSSSMIIGFDSDNVEITQPYALTTQGAEEIRFFKNGRIDVRFKDAGTAETCFRKLKLDTIQLENNDD